MEKYRETDRMGRKISMASIFRILLFLGVVFFLGSCTAEYDWPPESSPTRPAEGTTSH
jgi:hypothetical protein